ncbi:MAG TPA: hypothetical protein VN903_17170 [Polyangia bacterium]|nr:hypothetical protein [Polyangia bacterium]
MLYAGCSSDNNGPTGGPVMGALDMHCAATGPTIIGECMTGTAPVDAAAPDPDGGAPTSDYGDTLYNAEGDDDDCKYHVKWTATPIREKTAVTFTVTLTKLADMTPATGAGINAEVFLNATHPAVPPPQATESAGGKYTVGPIKFDASGNWTVRFHFFEDCNDAPEDSPHGHAAFFVHVP